METIVQRGAGAAQLVPDVDLPGELAELDPSDLAALDAWHRALDDAALVADERVLEQGWALADLMWSDEWWRLADQMARAEANDGDV